MIGHFLSRLQVILSRKMGLVNQPDRTYPLLHRATTVSSMDLAIYWKSLGQPWRTEPEISDRRQKFLARRHAIAPQIELGIYPFEDVKLGHADVEWLLATHENGRGPKHWSDSDQWQREGLDLRGANLRLVDLSGLPLARMRGGLTWEEWLNTIMEKRNTAGVHLEGADLRKAHLEGAFLMRAHLERAALRKAYLEQANLSSAYLVRVSFIGAHLAEADPRREHLEAANLKEAHLEGKPLSTAHLNVMRKSSKQLPSLQPADLRAAFFDSSTQFEGVILGEERFGFVFLADIHWNGVDLSAVNWEAVNMLGDESRAREMETSYEAVKDRATRIVEYEGTIRANRQLANILRGQGLNEQAAHFAYRSQVLQRLVFRRQRKFRQYLSSLFLDLLTGYDYKPGRSFLAYLLAIFSFSTIYYLLGLRQGLNFSITEAFVFSVTYFDRRGFFSSSIPLDNPVFVVAAVEAFVGLVIEVTMIATLTLQLFGK